MRTWLGSALQGRLVPDLRLVVVAHLAVGVADVVGDVGMLVMAECVHGGDTGLIVAVENKLAGGAIVAQEFLLRELLLLLLDGIVVLLLLFLLAVVGGGRIVGTHCKYRHRLDADAVTSNAAAASTPARRRAWIKVMAGALLQKTGSASPYDKAGGYEKNNP